MGAVGGEDVAEDAEVGGDALGDGAVGGGGEVDGAAGVVLILKVGEEGLVVGEVGDVEGDGGGGVAFEGGFALKKPGGDGEDGCGVLADEDEDGVDEGVGFDEGSVEVDAEGGKQGWVRGRLGELRCAVRGHG